MQCKKLFFPIGAGDDVKERMYGALLIAKHFDTYVEILASQLDPSVVYNMKMALRGGVLYEEFLKAAHNELKVEHNQNEEIFKKLCAELDIEISDKPTGRASANFITKSGKRSILVEQESKFCDMVIAAVPLDGKITGTFEAAVLKSGKTAITIPRNLKKFSTDNILVSWNGSIQNSRALSSSIELLKKAKRVHCITCRTSLNDESVEESLKKLEKYLDIHDIKATFEIVTTTAVPGEALLKSAKDGNFDLIVAGRHGENGFLEIFLGGTSRYFLKNTTIPVFM
ncbi:universal stress protein [Campylobacter sp. RM16192]|uniref:universal stress protein n=1 Tax=Campylobacter sp. RM16192 TaxID=1660080 RepID=UPI0014519B7F|nr:universal stress protein [Campylobacter sp. RM16192]QCD53038.1 putative universal stress protein UspA [Campylobacter sp. RM16192]